MIFIEQRYEDNPQAVVYDKDGGHRENEDANGPIVSLRKCKQKHSKLVSPQCRRKIPAMGKPTLTANSITISRLVDKAQLNDQQGPQYQSKGKVGAKWRWWRIKRRVKSVRRIGSTAGRSCLWPPQASRTVTTVATVRLNLRSAWSYVDVVPSRRLPAACHKKKPGGEVGTHVFCLCSAAAATFLCEHHSTLHRLHVPLCRLSLLRRTQSLLN